MGSHLSFYEMQAKMPLYKKGEKVQSFHPLVSFLALAH